MQKTGRAAFARRLPALRVGLLLLFAAGCGERQGHEGRLGGSEDAQSRTTAAASSEPAVRSPPGPAAGLAGRDRPSVLLVTFDTTRLDAVSSYGLIPGITPEIDRLAASGIRYESARTVAPLTLPAHASMLTGLYPLRHGIRDNSLSVLPEEASTLAEVAQGAGYQTAAFVSSVVLKGVYGLAQGFDVYDEPRQDYRHLDTRFEERPASETASRAIGWLSAREPDRPFFLWVHFFDPHVPYQPPPEFLPRARGNPYLAEVAAADHHLGRIVQKVDPAATVMIVTADHGEGLGEHGERTHGVYCYDSTLRVPFIIRYPDGHRAGESSLENVSVADVFPTLAEAMGAEVEAGLDGQSLYKRRISDGRGVYFESYHAFLNYGWSPIAGWMSGAAKYLHSSKPELFHLGRDSGELQNVAAGNAEITTRAVRAIRGLAALPGLASEEHGHEEVLEQLRALGYATGGTSEEIPHPLAKTGLPSPSERVEELDRFLRAVDAGNAGDTRAAIQTLRQILDENPRNTSALDNLAALLLSENRIAEARQALTQMLELGAERWTTHLNLGFCYEQEGRLAEARRHYERCLILDPTNVKALVNLARVLEALGEPGEAGRVRSRLDRLKASGV